MFFFLKSQNILHFKEKKIGKENRESNKWNNIQEFRFSFSSPGIFSKSIDYYYSTHTCVEAAPVLLTY
jgi:hypothetical protein